MKTKIITKKPGFDGPKNQSSHRRAQSYAMYFLQTFPELE